MNKIGAAFALGLISSVAQAQSTSPAATTSAAPAGVVTTSTASRTTAAPVSGANSFTETEARRRIEGQGFTQVMGLKKDDHGIWRGTANKDGKPAQVALDYQGNVVGQ